MSFKHGFVTEDVYEKAVCKLIVIGCSFSKQQVTIYKFHHSLPKEKKQLQVKADQTGRDQAQ